VKGPFCPSTLRQQPRDWKGRRGGGLKLGKKQNRGEKKKKVCYPNVSTELNPGDERPARVMAKVRSALVKKGGEGGMMDNQKGEDFCN